MREQQKEIDPYYYYDPSSGVIGDNQKGFLERWLKPEDIPQKLDGQLDVFKSTAPIRAVFGGNQCLGGETEIYDPIKNEYIPVSKIEKRFSVKSFDGKEIVTEEARKPFQKDLDDIYEIGLSNGNKFTASMGHLVLTPFGYRTISDVLQLSLPILQETIGGSYRIIPFSDDHRYGETIQGSQDDCLSCCHFYDEQLLSDLNNAPSVPPWLYSYVTSVVYKRRDIKWDFEVPVNNNYVASGIIHHNSGKSTVLAISAFIAMTGYVPKILRGHIPEDVIPKKFPVRGRIVGVDHKTLLNTLIPTFQQWCPKDFLKNHKWSDSYSSEQNMLTLQENGQLIATCDFMTNQQEVESFQGPPRDFIFYDEEPKLAIYRENLMRFTTANKVNVMFAMTPTHGVGSWVYDEIVQKSELGSIKAECFKLTSVTNRKANIEVLEEILKGVGSYEDIQMRLLGAFVSLSGLVYGRLFNRNIHVVEPFEIDRSFLVVRGIDPHLVKPTVCVEMAVDREGNCYVIGVYEGDKDVEEVKRDLKERMSKYRLGWTMCDRSADSTLRVLGDRNIFKELSTGVNAIPALFTSEKYTGSIHAGVDEIKRRLRINERTGKPSLFFFDIPENRKLIQAMQTLERETHLQEEKRGVVDKIAEGKHDAHAAMRYIFQRVVCWIPDQVDVPAYVPDNASIGY